MTTTSGQKGFSLIEVLLSLTMIGMLAGVSLPIYNSFAVRNDLDLTTQQVANALRRAQTYARGMQENSAWSVRVESSAVTVFKGTNFGARDTAFDEPTPIPSSMSVSGLTQVQFAKLTAAPNTTGSIVLTSTNNDERTITINTKGMVDYEATP